MLDNIIWGNTVQEWIISLVIIAVTVLITKLVSLFNKRVLKKLTRKTANRLDDIVYDAMEQPILFGIMLVGIWIAIHRLLFPQSLVDGVFSAYKILIVLNITWFFARLASSLIDVYWINSPNGATRHGARMMPVVKRTILVLVWVIGLVMALNNVGVNINALLGTLGIGGIAFALAAQDTIKNIFGAFTILTDRPFSIGDTIRIDQFEGTIIDVGVRSTKMRNYDKRLITFPNYKVADASIVNVSSEPMRRVVMKLGLTYDTSAEKLENAMNMLKQIPSKVEFVSPKDLVVQFSDFLDSALAITFIYFIEKKGDIGQVTSDVNLEVLRTFNNAGLDFAFPTQTLYIDKETQEKLLPDTDKNIKKDEN